MCSYSSDVRGAFDRVRKERLMGKLGHAGVPEWLARIIDAWLDARRAAVTVAGEKAEEYTMEGAVYQGTITFKTPSQVALVS